MVRAAGRLRYISPREGHPELYDHGRRQLSKCHANIGGPCRFRLCNIYQCRFVRFGTESADRLPRIGLGV